MHNPMVTLFDFRGDAKLLSKGNNTISYSHLVAFNHYRTSLTHLFICIYVYTCLYAHMCAHSYLYWRLISPFGTEPSSEESPRPLFGVCVWGLSDKDPQGLHKLVSLLPSSVLPFLSPRGWSSGFSMVLGLTVGQPILIPKGEGGRTWR